MDLANTIYDAFVKSTDPKVIIEKASEIKAHIKSIGNKEPNDEVGEELLYLLGAKKESIEWLLLLTIIDRDDDKIKEYLKSIKQCDISISQCEWALLILSEIRTISKSEIAIYVSELITHLDNLKVERLNKKIENKKNTESKEDRIGFWRKLFRKKSKSKQIEGAPKLRLAAKEQVERVKIELELESQHLKINAVSKNEILESNISPIVEIINRKVNQIIILDHELINLQSEAKDKRALELVNKLKLVRFSISGYDDDPRNLWDIQEVNHWAWAWIKYQPYSLLFLEEKSFLVLLLICLGSKQGNRQNYFAPNFNSPLKSKFESILNNSLKSLLSKHGNPYLLGAYGFARHSILKTQIESMQNNLL